MLYFFVWRMYDDSTPGVADPTSYDLINLARLGRRYCLPALSFLCPTRAGGKNLLICECHNNRGDFFVTFDIVDDASDARSPFQTFDVNLCTILQIYVGQFKQNNEAFE